MRQNRSHGYSTTNIACGPAVIPCPSRRDENVVDELAHRRPAVVTAWVDSGYQRSVIDRGAVYGIDVQVVTKDPAQRGFKPQRTRWAVERTFGWLMLHRRLARDYELPGDRGNSYYPEVLVIPSWLGRGPSRSGSVGTARDNPALQRLSRKARMASGGL
jgi:transposase